MLSKIVLFTGAVLATIGGQAEAAGLGVASYPGAFYQPEGERNYFSHPKTEAELEAELEAEVNMERIANLEQEVATLKAKGDVLEHEIATNLKGEKGDTGAKGDKGTTGKAGAAGGPRGKTGKTGKKGPKGDKGGLFRL